jgi:aromatic-L-amino-acid decarboxylase
MRVPGELEGHPEPELVDYRRSTTSRAALEALGAAAWKLALDYLYGEALRRPVGAEPYRELRRAFFGDGPGSPPRAATPSSEILEEVRDRLAPRLYSAYHPGSFSYFTPPPLAMSIVGEMLAQWMNQGVDVWNCGPAAALVEEEVIAWLCELVGYGDGGFGVLTSGGTHANVMALSIARDVHLAKLLGASTPPRAGSLEKGRLYASDQTHFSIARGMDLLGFPPEAMRTIPSDERFRMDPAAAARAISDDRAAGLTPFAIAAVSGSTNTGSVDPLHELAELAAREGLWLHADAAYGGAARLSARDAARVPGLSLADSITIDPHKWFFQAYDVGALLVRRREDLRRAFHSEPEYYGGGSSSEEPLHWYQYSLESTRRFRGLKLWLSWKHLGTGGLGRLVERTIDLAGHLAQRCREADDFEVEPAEPELSVVCFRHVPDAGADPGAIDRYQVALQRALEVSGEGWVSTTTLRGRTFLRAGVMNYMSTPADVDRVLETLRRLSPQAAANAGMGAEA